MQQRTSITSSGLETIDHIRAYYRPARWVARLFIDNRTQRLVAPTPIPTDDILIDSIQKVVDTIVLLDRLELIWRWPVYVHIIRKQKGTEVITIFIYHSVIDTTIIIMIITRVGLCVYLNMHATNTEWKWKKTLVGLKLYVALKESGHRPSVDRWQLTRSDSNERISK